EAGVLLREARRLLGEPKLAADAVHEVRSVGAVEHRERGVQPDRIGMQPQQPVGDAVERARPAEFAGAGRLRRERPGLAEDTGTITGQAGYQPTPDDLTRSGHWAGRLWRGPGLVCW